eukprot:6914164-Lingulodinium_polyedra.AAC.1
MGKRIRLGARAGNTTHGTPKKATHKPWPTEGPTRNVAHTRTNCARNPTGSTQDFHNAYAGHAARRAVANVGTG